MTIQIQPPSGPIADATPEQLQAIRDGLDVPSNDQLAQGLSGKANSSHAHAISAVTGLQAALDALRASTPIIAIAGTSHTLATANAGAMLRYSATGAKTLTVDAATGHTAGAIYHVTNRAAAGDLTLTPVGGMVLNAPKGGTLVLEPGDTVSLHCVSGSVMDVYGSTKGAA